MKPELEKLIDMVVSDGVVSEKERGFILRKAAELGEDTEEVELVLQYRLESAPPPPSAKPGTHASVPQGTQSTCHGCGAAIAGHFVCEFCGTPTSVYALSEADEFAMLREISTAAQRILTSHQGAPTKDATVQYLRAKEVDHHIGSFWQNAPLPRTTRPLMQVAREALASITGATDALIDPLQSESARFARAETALATLRTDVSVPAHELDSLNQMLEAKRALLTRAKRKKAILWAWLIGGGLAFFLFTLILAVSL